MVKSKNMQKELQSMLENSALAWVTDGLLALAKPSLRLLLKVTPEKELAVGSSKSGGYPDLPSAETWPTWKGIPLAFVVQINLAEVHSLLPTSLLPPAGLLSFFFDADHVPVGYDPAWRGGWRVLFTEEGETLERIPTPPDLYEKAPTWMPPGNHYPASAIQFVLEMTLPPFDFPEIETLGLNQKEQNSYLEILSQLEERLSAPLHRLLGYPDALQGDMQLMCELASRGYFLGKGLPDEARTAFLLSRASRWHLLLQLDTDTHRDMIWAIEGRCSFWMPHEALRQKQFEQSWFLMQWT
jgi:uncharacterized protein YwqG